MVTLNPDEFPADDDGEIINAAVTLSQHENGKPRLEHSVIGATPAVTFYDREGNPLVILADGNDGPCVSIIDPITGRTMLLADCKGERPDVSLFGDDGKFSFRLSKG